MPIRNLHRIFKPKSVAVIGASAIEGKVGHTVLRNLVAGGFTGVIYPVNPKCGEVEKLQVYARVSDLPEPADLAIICTPAATVPQLVRECGEAGVLGLVILSAGFREMNADGALLEQAIKNEAQRFNGLRIIGPNCLGVISPLAKLNASFANAMPSKGRVAFISQSGALCTSILDWARQECIGFSHFVSVGNMLDVGIADLIDYFALDQSTDSIIMYVESIKEAREFMSAARAFTRNKPIIVYKAGRFAESAQAAASHTGALAGVDAVYEAAFARAGIVRVFDVEDMFDCAELLARQKAIHGPRLAIVTNAGGPGVMATDALLENKGILAHLSEKTLQRLNEQLPPAWSHGNPVDVLGDATPDRLGNALRTVLADSQVDAALVILSPQAMTNPTECAMAVVEAGKHSNKPQLTSWMGGVSMRVGIELLNTAGVPTYSTPEKAIRAFMHLVRYSRMRDMLYEAPREVPMEFSLDRIKLRAEFEAAVSEGQDILSECASKALLEAYEIPVTKTYLARSTEEAVQHASRVGFPVVLKVYSLDITHKTDVGGVALNLANADDVVAAFERVTNQAKQQRPDACVEGVTVQKMVTAAGGRELIVGSIRDPVFGAVMLVGAGGTAAEILQDRALELPPLSERLARRMLQSLRLWPLLQGYRGRPGVNIDRLIEVLMRLSYLVADCPEIAEMDVNPLLVTPTGVIALDARIVLDRQAVAQPRRPYSHLAIRPYPDEFIKRAKLKDDTSVLLRPIKPEDEPLWHELLASCSPETIHSRFRCMFKTQSHEMASRFCFVDYDREIAIVAEIEDHDHRRLIGVGRLVADADHREAEYASLVGDPWQGKGLGSLLTDYCLDICKRWGIRSVTAETAPMNDRMLHVFKRRDFNLENTDDVIMARKYLSVT